MIVADLICIPGSRLWYSSQEARHEETWQQARAWTSNKWREFAKSNFPVFKLKILYFAALCNSFCSFKHNFLRFITFFISFLFRFSQCGAVQWYSWTNSRDLMTKEGNKVSCKDWVCSEMVMKNVVEAAGIWFYRRMMEQVFTCIRKNKQSIFFRHILRRGKLEYVMTTENLEGKWGMGGWERMREKEKRGRVWERERVNERDSVWERIWVRKKKREWGSENA